LPIYQTALLTSILPPCKMLFRTTLSAGLIAAAHALPQAISQISDGQVQVPTATPIAQISDGQIQNPAPTPAGAPAASAATGNYSPLPYSYSQEPYVDSSAVSSAASVAGLPVTAIPGATNAVPPRVSSQVTGVTSHGPYSGTPTTVGAVSNSPAGTAIPALPPNPTALRYDPSGKLNDQEPIPYQPAGGLGTNGTEPVYRVQSDFDYQSILVGLYQVSIMYDI
jgi:hypothetical protein